MWAPKDVDGWDQLGRKRHGASLTDDTLRVYSGTLAQPSTE